MDVSKVLGIASQEMMIGDLPKTAAGSQRSIWKKEILSKWNEIKSIIHKGQRITNVWRICGQHLKSNSSKNKMKPTLLA